MCYRVVMAENRKSGAMQRIRAGRSVGISELKRTPAGVISEAKLGPIVIFNRNIAVGYLISPELWEDAADALEMAQNKEND
jgi:antitoxin StbD